MGRERHAYSIIVGNGTDNVVRQQIYRYGSCDSCAVSVPALKHRNRPHVPPVTPAQLMSREALFDGSGIWQAACRKQVPRNSPYPAWAAWALRAPLACSQTANES